MARKAPVTEEYPSDTPSDAEPPLLTLDDLFGMEVDTEEQKQVQAALLLPAGQYIKLPHEAGQETTFARTRMEDVETLVKGDDDEYEAATLATRDVVRVFAPMQAKDVKIVRFGFRVSWIPVYRQYEGQPVKPDTPTKLYNMAFTLYKRVHPENERPSVGEIITFLVEDTYKVYITQYGTRKGSVGEPGNGVGTISKA